MVFCNLGITRKNRKQLMVFSILRIFLVIRLGFEPKTPTLKVLCSTD